MRGKMAEKKKRSRIKSYAVVTVASLLYGVAVSLFLDPNNIAPGGVTGLAMIVNRLIRIETGTLILLLNIPILILGLRKFGFHFLVSTIYATILTSLFTNYFAGYSPITEDPLLAAVIGGSLAALALGLVFKSGATTGGTDIVVKVLRLRFPHLKTGRLFMICDLVVVGLSAIVFKNVDSAFYAAISVMLMGVVFDMVLYGADGAKLLYIISDYWQEIGDRILQELDIGVTYLEGEGAYSKKTKRVIMCVVRKQLAPQIEEIVKEEDKDAFMIISSATEIYGEGYKNIFSEKI
ncbi:MAG: YitT family protein [Lachnospiraceae bacterium]|nr:YitT family protein [Lachnospiraceae bacterium]